ncbi:hypothetical protein BJX96DRAFT_157099, partial [Aspergillus floccosus]
MCPRATVSRGEESIETGMPKKPKGKRLSQRKETKTSHRIRPPEAESSESHRPSPKFVWPFSLDTFRRVDKYRLPNHGIEATTRSTDRDRMNKDGADPAPTLKIPEGFIYVFIFGLVNTFPHVTFFFTHEPFMFSHIYSDLSFCAVRLIFFCLSFIISLVFGDIFGILLARRGHLSPFGTEYSRY